MNAQVAISVIFGMGIVAGLGAEEVPGESTAKKPSIVPTFAEQKYGTHQAQVFDIWSASDTQATPLLVFIHGGGFRAGNRDAINEALLAVCLKAGISFATIEYRLSGIAPYPAQMHDAARAIQYIRSKATEYRIDPRRIAATGPSAGSGISQWLAFHDDLADPDNADPVLRESTRLTCAIPTKMQCTYDSREVRKIVPGMKFTSGAIKQWHGLPDTFNWDSDPIDAALDAALKDCSPITHLTKDDPPVFILCHMSKNIDGDPHHPNFGKRLKMEMDKLAIECEIHFDTEIKTSFPELAVEFLKKHFAMLGDSELQAADK